MGERSRAGLARIEKRFDIFGPTWPCYFLNQTFEVEKKKNEGKRVLNEGSTLDRASSRTAEGMQFWRDKPRRYPPSKYGMNR